MKIILRLLVWMSGWLWALNSLAASPIVPENVLSRAEIDYIEQSRDFFYYRSLDAKTPIWKRTKRKYSSHFLNSRTHFFNQNEVIHRVLTDGFATRARLTQLYRAQMGVHSALGDVLPRLDITIGEGASPVNLNRAFAGLFNFILPANWLRLSSQQRVYKATKYILMRTVLDEILNAKLMYIKQHKLIQEFEILNYYFIHLQILAEMYPPNNRAIETIFGKFAFDGTRMSGQRGDTKLGFDDLALLMALDKVEGRHSADMINIADIDEFPRRVKDLSELDEIHRDKELFLEQVVRRSVELKAVREFYKISQLNVGIVATGGSLGAIDRPGNLENDARFAFRFGYGSLPNVLIANSFSKSARIDVQREYVNMLDNARRSFDYYANALGGYTEAKRSFAINRHAFIKNLEYLNASNQEPDALFILSLNQLVDSELRLNNALHGSLTAQAYMDRFLLVDREGALNYLPERGKIIEIFDSVKGERQHEVRRDEYLNFQLENVDKSSHLITLLYEPATSPDLSEYSLQDIEEGVKRNVGNLLYAKMPFGKTRHFYQVLAQYFAEHHVELSSSEAYLLKRKSTSLWDQVFRRHSVSGTPGLQNFDFEKFEVTHT